MLLTLKNHIFEANLLLSTLNPDNDSQSDSTSISRSVQPVRKRNTSRNVSKHVNKTSSNRKYFPRKKSTVIHKSAINNTFKIPDEDNLTESQYDQITGASTSVVVKEVEINNSITSDIQEMNQKPERNRLFARNSPSTMSWTSNKRISEGQQKLVSTVFSSITKRKSTCDDESSKEKEKADIDLEENVPRSPPPRLVAKRARVVFQKCFQTTFDPHMLSGHDVILAEDSEEDNSD